LIQQSFLLYEQVDPAQKTPAWANFVVTILRRDWRSLININRSRVNKQYLNALQPMDKIRAKFKDKEFLATNSFLPLGIFDNIKNNLIETLLQNPPKAELRATDPSSVNLKKKDIQLLKNRKIVEGDISKYNAQVGLPPHKIGYDKFNSNIEEFDRLKLNENDSDDVNFYSDIFQRLLFEIAGQQVINNVMKVNRFDETTVRRFVMDLLSDNAIALQSYVDKMTGAIRYKYLFPEICYGIFNDTNDGNNDLCKGWQDSITVMDFLSMAGNEFDWNRDWRKLLYAINYGNGYKFTGFIRNNSNYDCCGNVNWEKEGGMEGWPSSLCEWSLAYTYKVYGGYIEWNTAEATQTYLKKYGDERFIEEIPYNYALKTKKQVKEYYKESYYQQQWYSTYFLATTSISHWIYGFGKVYYQQLEGVNDEYASGTLRYFINEGRSAVEIAKEYIDLANTCFYKMLWVIDKAKPEDEIIVMEELIQVSKGFQRLFQQNSTNQSVQTIDNILKNVIQYQRENFVKLRAFPQADGKTIQQLPPMEGRRNGIDLVAAALQTMMIWAESQVANKIGLMGTRAPENIPSRQPGKTTEQQTEQSYNSTNYIYRSIQFIKERIATDTLYYAQDIINFKDTVPYNWLQRLIGDDMFASLPLLEKFAAHRMGIFVKDYNSDFDKKMLAQAAYTALEQGKIEYDDFVVITQTEDSKLGNKIFAYRKLKKEKKLRQQQIQDMQIKDEMAKNQYDRDKDLLVTKINGDIRRATIEASGTVKAAEINSGGRVKIKEMTIENEPQKQAAKSESQKEIAEKKENLKESKPYPVEGAATG
jgi:hypothetical protein